MAATADNDTRTRILDAAERSFAERGFAASSLRQIIAAAGVNLAAIHYHFGPKEALVAAVFERRIAPMNAERFALLDAAEAAAGRKPVPVGTIVAAFVGPAMRMASDTRKGGAVVVRLFGRLIAEPSAEMQAMLSAQFGMVLKRFTAALRRALPRCPEEVLLWRFNFMIGTMAHVMADPVNLKQTSRGQCDPRDTETAIEQMVAFVSEGFSAKHPKGRRA